MTMLSSPISRITCAHKSVERKRNRKKAWGINGVGWGTNGVSITIFIYYTRMMGGVWVNDGIETISTQKGDKFILFIAIEMQYRE
jgi:hypothetical protein